MKAKVLDADKQRVLKLQSNVVHQLEFFLAGGTGLGLRLGHRVSRDLDWFTPHAFDAKQREHQLAALPEKPTKINLQGSHTVRAYYGELETSFLRYSQVPAKTEVLTVGTLKIPVADMNTLAVMKAAAVHDRGTRRDFVDIHAICRTPGWSVGHFIDLATSRLPLAPAQMKLALTYYADAERDVVRFRYDVPWERVKTDLQKGILAWERNRSRRQNR
jgi:hypothetical protein